MPSSIASAPGRVILFGEHAVQHGVTSCGACLSDMRTVVQLDIISDPNVEIHLNDYPAAGREAKVIVIPSVEISGALKRREEPIVPLVPTEDMISSLRTLVPESDVAESDKSIMSVCFLTANIIPELLWGDTKRGISVSIKSRGLPIAVGLGSSASFCVALSAALLRLRQLMYGDILPQDFPIEDIAGDDSPDGWSPPAVILNMLNGWAYAAEVIVHGEPSGLDNTTCCFGGAVRLNRVLGRFETLPLLPEMDFLLTNTKINRDSKTLNEAVASLNRSWPGVVKPIFESIEAISQEFMKLIDSFNTNTPSECHADIKKKASDIFFDSMGELIDLNRSLLDTLDLGHPALTKVAEISRTVGNCPCKQTGSGVCAITLLKSVNDEAAAHIREAMRLEGFDTYQSPVGGIGVKWHGKYPPDTSQVILGTNKRNKNSTPLNKDVEISTSPNRYTNMFIGTLLHTFALICAVIFSGFLLKWISFVAACLICAMLGYVLGLLFGFA